MGRRRDDDEPDLFAGLAAKEEALDRVAENSGGWWDEAMTSLRKVPLGTEGTAEKFGRLMREGGLGPPHHPNVWGAFTNRALKAGLLEDLDTRRPMEKPSSHARRTPVYRRI